MIPEKSVKNDISFNNKQPDQLVIAMKIAYNISDKTLLAEPVLIVRFVPDAQRNQNFAHISGSPQSDSLWRYLFYSSVLQKTQIKMAFAEKGSFSSITVGVGFIRPELSGLDKSSPYFHLIGCINYLLKANPL